MLSDYQNKNNDEAFISADHRIRIVHWRGGNANIIFAPITGVWKDIAVLSPKHCGRSKCRLELNWLDLLRLLRFNVNLEANLFLRLRLAFQYYLIFFLPFHATEWIVTPTALSPRIAAIIGCDNVKRVIEHFLRFKCARQVSGCFIE